MFQPTAVAPQKPETIDWRKELEDIERDFKEGKITEIEFQKKRKALDAEQKVQEICNTMRDFV